MGRVLASVLGLFIIIGPSVAIATRRACWYGMCFALTYLFNTRLGRDTKLFTLQPNTRIELKWFVNAGAESGLGVSVAGVDKHDTTHALLWVLSVGGPQGMEVRFRRGEAHLRTNERTNECAVQPPKRI